MRKSGPGRKKAADGGGDASEIGGDGLYFLSKKFIFASDKDGIYGLQDFTCGTQFDNSPDEQGDSAGDRVYGTDCRIALYGACGGSARPPARTYLRIAERQHAQECDGRGHSRYGRHDRASHCRGTGSAVRKVGVRPRGAARRDSCGCAAGAPLYGGDAHRNRAETGWLRYPLHRGGGGCWERQGAGRYREKSYGIYTD